MSTRTRVLVPLCLAVLYGGATPAFAVKPAPAPLSIVVNSVTSTSHLFANQCRGTTNITSNGFKGKTPNVWMLRNGVSPVNLGPAVKGVATTYTLPLLPNGETFTPMAFELRDSRGRMIARDEENVTVSCVPGLQILSVDSVPYPGRPDLCALPLTWQANLLPDGVTSQLVIRRINDNANAYSGVEYMTPENLGTPRTEAAGFPGAIGREVDSGVYSLWLEYFDNDVVLGRSNSIQVNATCATT